MTNDLIVQYTREQAIIRLQDKLEALDNRKMGDFYEDRILRSLILELKGITNDLISEKWLSERRMYWHSQLMD